MLALYIFCLVLGGSLMLVSVLGDVFGDAGGDMDLDVGGDLDLQLDAGDFDVDAGQFDLDAGDMDVEVHGHAAEATHATKILSLRTLIYALFGFGAVGTLLSFLGPGGFAGTLAFAVTGGFLSGAVVTTVFNYLKRTDTGAQLSDAAYVGLSGTVTLPIGPGSPGAVAVERGHRRISLRALPHPSADEGDPSSWRSVVVVDMDRGVARVAPVEEDLGLEP